MNDCELLELAARAAGIKGEVFFLEGLGAWVGLENFKQWNPLTDDGDALRLAVKLGIRISPPDDGDNVASATHWSIPLFLAEKESSGGALAATRLAIVRAAAEIGKGIKQVVSDDLPDEDNYYGWGLEL